MQSGGVPALSEGDVGRVRGACRASSCRRAGRTALHMFVMRADLIGRRRP